MPRLSDKGKMIMINLLFWGKKEVRGSGHSSLVNTILFYHIVPH